MNDSKTLSNRQTNFFLLQRLMSFFLDTKEASWLMNFALTLGGNGSRLLLFSLSPESLCSAAICRILNKPRSRASSCWESVISSCAGGKGNRSWVLLRESCLVRDLSAAAKTNKANSPHGQPRTHGFGRSLLVAQSTGWEHLRFEGASSPFWLTTFYKAHFHLIYLFWLSNKQVMSHLLSS